MRAELFVFYFSMLLFDFKVMLTFQKGKLVLGSPRREDITCAARWRRSEAVKVGTEQG